MQKRVYPCECVGDWQTFSETLLHEKEDIYSNFNMGDITDANYAHGNRLCKDFKIKYLGEYNGLYAQSITLLLAGLFDLCVLNYMNLILLVFLLHQT